MDTGNCVSCKFFEDAANFWNGNDDEKRLSDDKQMYGFCRRHAPRPHRGLEIKELQWPIVHCGSDWCGEYVYKPEDAEATDGTQSR